MTMSQQDKVQTLMMLLFDGHNADVWGTIPSLIDRDDSTPMWEQINNNHQNGWLEVKRHPVYVITLQYPDHTEMRPYSIIARGDEMIVLFRHSFVVWIEDITARDLVTKIARIN